MVEEEIPGRHCGGETYAIGSRAVLHSPLADPGSALRKWNQTPAHGPGVMLLDGSGGYVMFAKASSGELQAQSKSSRVLARSQFCFYRRIGQPAVAWHG